MSGQLGSYMREMEHSWRTLHVHEHARAAKLALVNFSIQRCCRPEPKRARSASCAQLSNFPWLYKGELHTSRCRITFRSMDDQTPCPLLSARFGCVPQVNNAVVWDPSAFLQGKPPDAPLHSRQLRRASTMHASSAQLRNRVSRGCARMHGNSARMQGNCSTEWPEAAKQLPGAALLPRQPGQCLVTFDRDLFTLSPTGSHKLWLHGLYLRDARAPGGGASAVLVSAVSAIRQGDSGPPHLWMTNCSVQGADSTPLLAVRVSGKLFAQGARGALCHLLPPSHACTVPQQQAVLPPSLAAAVPCGTVPCCSWLVACDEHVVLAMSLLCRP
jgi:hypothetical protein